MRTLRRSILAMATNIIARIKAIFEYVSVPATNKLQEIEMKDVKTYSLLTERKFLSLWIRT
jgi:hypothetical protein